VNGPLYPYTLPDLYDGSEIFLVGLSSGSSLIQINGTAPNGTRLSWTINATVSSENNNDFAWVERLYVTTVIDDLLVQIAYFSEDTTAQKNLVTSLALTYGFVTPYTSMAIDVDFSLLTTTPITVPGNLPGSYTGGQYYPTTAYGAYTSTYTQVLAAAATAVTSVTTEIILLSLGCLGILVSLKRNRKA
jgi:hypothetical protein